MVITTLINQLLIAIPSIIIGTQTLTSVFNGIFKIDKSWARHLVSWILAVIIAVVFVATGGVSFGLSELWNYIVGIIGGIIAGGAANGFYDWKVISDVFEGLENKIRGPERRRIRS
jgi:uncharacterized protein (DUF697 family)